MLEYKAKTIRALDRGIQVLEYLYSSGGATLDELYKSTGLHRATLIRILMTLKDNDLVWQRLADGVFLPGYRWERFNTMPSINMKLAKISAPILLELCNKTLWPSVIGVPGTGCLEVLETNASQSYFDEIPLGPVGYKINYLRSASGRSYLAHCSGDEREGILSTLRRSGMPGDMMAHDVQYVERVIAETRSRGYGIRDNDFGGDYNKTRDEYDDGRYSIAIPLSIKKHGTFAVLNMTWKSSVLGLEEGIERNLNHLKWAGRRIEKAVRNTN